ncbi:MAG: hypothetical protein ACT6SC_19895 [Blastomonas fulva]
MNDPTFSEDERTVDTTALSEIIKDAFLLSMDNRLSDSQQGQLSASARVLRIQLQPLLGRIFDAGAVELNTANAKLKAVNKKLKEAQAAIEKVADTIEQMGALVKQLDTLLDIVGIGI